MAAPGISPMTPQRWIGNLLEVAAEIADKQKQEARWLAPDAMAWERPEELFVDLFDAYNFEEFLEAFSSIFDERQQQAASRLLSEMDRFNEETPGNLDPAEVLADARWNSIRACASEFTAALKVGPALQQRKLGSCLSNPCRLMLQATSSRLKAQMLRGSCADIMP